MSQTFTWESVKNYNGTNGLFWIVIHGCVHDVTTFLKQHPGGEEVLRKLAGKDATECFEEVGHSEEAKQLCKSFKIGKIIEHPGGEEVLLEQSGKDASEAFEDVGHSTDARDMMENYKIGELIEADRTKVSNDKKEQNWTPENPEGSSSWKSWLVPIALGIFATVVYQFFLKK
uniref:Cytochrome b5 n=1 Tax=Clastoptera arizonana TaxID=38151 RepID=A0A1B6CHQ8_9HEMI